MNPQILFGITVVPAIIGLVQVAKIAGVPGRAAPLVAVILGVLAGVAELYSQQLPWIQAAVVGISLGLSAVGLYSGTQAVLQLGQSNSGAPKVTPPPTK